MPGVEQQNQFVLCVRTMRIVRELICTHRVVFGVCVRSFVARVSVLGVYGVHVENTLHYIFEVVAFGHYAEQTTTKTPPPTFTRRTRRELGTTGFGCFVGAVKADDGLMQSSSRHKKMGREWETGYAIASYDKSGREI